MNKDLALKLMTEPPKSKSGNLLQDSRFKAMFENPDFQVDKSATEYRYVIVHFYLPLLEIMLYANSKFDLF